MLFRSAGGQHACLIADVLGMNTVLVHPFAGVLSAYGMGLADVRALRERTIEAPLAADLVPRLERELDELAAVSEAEVSGQGITDDRIEQMRSNGFTDDEIWDIGAITAFFALSNRLANFAGIPPNDEFFTMGR